ncbi:uncharacterized protein LOC105686947 [Athalia rosae]|uniref:uncharacterized protein LOC105686947 n=1 Tax=Athalia rosae TaxID=37344 RepID=UPI0020348C83|nr:uncharacterized protein LOC105686947 [Athalia rosae]XP_048505083.1 uncharacterized protein LOC105686947 [Athalia rosae]XP_048505084.1 uncharacterized protein LOC105686947 [Athalia rosae]
MTRTEVIFVLFALFGGIFISTADGGGEKLLSRRKRYVVFPEGSSFSIALCMTVHTLTPDNIFTEGLNWGVSYDLPNESKPELSPLLQFRSDKIPPNKYVYKDLQNNRNKLKYSSWNNDRKYFVSGPTRYLKPEKYYVQRRHRRDLYNKLEVIMNAMGFDGRTCVLRALCEASQRLMPQGSTLIEEMMRITFSLPLKKVFSFEPPEHHVYDAAHRAGHQGRDCTRMFPSCSFSLIDMALGNYNSPTDANYDQVPDDNSSDERPGVVDVENSNIELPGVKYNMK